MKSFVCGSPLHVGDRARNSRGDLIPWAGQYTKREDYRSMDTSRRPHSRVLYAICFECMEAEVGPAVMEGQEAML